MKTSHRAGVLPIVVLAASAALIVGAGPSTAAVVTSPRPAADQAYPQVAAPPPGAIALAFANNQLTYCSLICPHMLDFVIDVPVALVRSPGVYSAALARTGSVDRARGMALASVTGPANSAISGIIGNDLGLVLPRAQNALEVAVVQMMHVADTARSGAPPAAVGQAFDTGRAEIVDALHAPIVPNPPQIATPTTPAQASVLDAIDVGSAVLFQAPELMMAGATDAADVAAKTWAASGDANAARTAGTERFNEVAAQAGDVIARATGKRWVPRG